MCTLNSYIISPCTTYTHISLHANSHAHSEDHLYTIDNTTSLVDSWYQQPLIESNTLSPSLYTTTMTRTRFDGLVAYCLLWISRAGPQVNPPAARPRCNNAVCAVHCQTRCNSCHELAPEHMGASSRIRAGPSAHTSGHVSTNDTVAIWPPLCSQGEYPSPSASVMSPLRCLLPASPVGMPNTHGVISRCGDDAPSPCVKVCTCIL